MLGTIVNTLAIIVGSVVGTLLKGGIPQKINDSIMKALALSVILIGVSGSLKNINILLIIISMVIGCVIGEVIDIDGSLKKLGDKIGDKLGGKSKGKCGKLSEAFVTSSLIFCVGAMAIVGSLESGLTGSNKTLFVKSVLDGITAVVFSSSMGIGVALSAIVVFIYQTILTIGAASLKGVLTPVVINNMTSIGSLLIVGIGFNILKIDKIKVANLIPAVFIPIFYQAILVFIK